MTTGITDPRLTDAAISEMDPNGRYKKFWIRSVSDATTPVVGEWLSIDTTAVTGVALGDTAKLATEITQAPVGVLVETIRSDGSNSIADYYLVCTHGVVDDCAAVAGVTAAGELLGLSTTDGAVDTHPLDGSIVICGYALEASASSVAKCMVTCG